MKIFQLKLKTENDFCRKFLPDYTRQGEAEWSSRPISLLKATSFIPRKLIDIEEACRHPEHVTNDSAVHFYRWDWILNRTRYTPEVLKTILPQGTWLLSQDFSMFRDMYPEENLWNWRRAHANAERMVQCGFHVIPSLSWAEEDTFDYCFRGIQPGGTVAVSTVGVKRDVWGRILFTLGMEKAIEILHPKCVIVYGSMLKFDFGNLKIICFPNTSYQWTKNCEHKEVI